MELAGPLRAAAVNSVQRRLRTQRALSAEITFRGGCRRRTFPHVPPTPIRKTSFLRAISSAHGIRLKFRRGVLLCPICGPAPRQPSDRIRVHLRDQRLHFSAIPLALRSALRLFPCVLGAASLVRNKRCWASSDAAQDTGSARQRWIGGLLTGKNLGGNLERVTSMRAWNCFGNLLRAMVRTSGSSPQRPAMSKIGPAGGGQSRIAMSSAKQVIGCRIDPDTG